MRRQSREGRAGESRRAENKKRKGNFLESSSLSLVFCFHCTFSLLPSDLFLLLFFLSFFMRGDLWMLDRFASLCLRPDTSRAVRSFLAVSLSLSLFESGDEVSFRRSLFGQRADPCESLKEKEEVLSLLRRDRAGQRKTLLRHPQSMLLRHTHALPFSFFLSVLSSSASLCLDVSPGQERKRKKEAEGKERRFL